MIAKYNIDESLLLMKLSKKYGIELHNLCFIPFGDSAYSYKVNSASGQPYYLKLFDHENDNQKRGILRLNHYLPLTWKLYHQGLFKNLTYPIQNLSGDFKTTLRGCTAVLFNFIKGETLTESYPFSKKLPSKVSSN